MFAPQSYVVCSSLSSVSPLRYGGLSQVVQQCISNSTLTYKMMVLSDISARSFLSGGIDFSRELRASLLLQGKEKFEI